MAVLLFMARLFTSGFETGDFTEWTGTTVTGGATVTVVTNPVNSGTYSFRSKNIGTTGIARARQDFSANNDGPFYARFYLYIVDLPAFEQAIFYFTTSTLTTSCYISLKEDGTLRLYDGGSTLVGSPSSALNLNTQYRIELSAQKSGTNGILELRLDGSTIASTSTGGSAKQIGTILVGMCQSVTSYELNIDDVAINDSTGGSDNSWPGAVGGGGSSPATVVNPLYLRSLK